MIKLNLGCGYNKLDGYINVDQDPNCNPDVVANLETKLPFDDSSVDEIVLNHVLEHLGQQTDTFLNIIKEFYRILSDQGQLKIVVPHHNHENFHHDPTHCRKITPVTIDMFNQYRNKQTIESGGQETTLGYQCNVDIEVLQVAYDCNTDMSNHNMQEIIDMSNTYGNVCSQVRINAIIHKPPRYHNYQ